MKTATYANEEQTKIIFNYDGRTLEVPVNPNNSVYKKIIADQIEIKPYNPPTPPPVTQVTAYQAKIQLSRAGLYDSVVTTVNTSDNPELKIAWEIASVFERNSPFILALQPELGLTDAQVDDLFQQASQIGTILGQQQSLIETIWTVDSSDLQSAKTTKYNQAVSEKDTLVANLVDPTTDASIVYISMLDDRLIEIQQEINSASTQQQLDAIDFNFPVFGG